MARYIVIRILLILALHVLLSTLAQADEPPATTFSITNVRVFGGKAVIEDACVHVQEGRIHTITQSDNCAEDHASIDGRGKTLMPGLIDAHTHVFMSARQEALQFGVTTMLDMFTAHQQLPAAKAARSTMEATSEADLFSAGTMITAEGGHGTQFGMDIPTIAAPDEAEQFVRDRIAEGSDYIKIVYRAKESERQFMPSIDRQTLEAVIDAAHKQGVMAVVHATNLVSAQHTIQAGADGLVHNFVDEVIDSASVAHMKENGQFMVTTMTVLESFTQYGEPEQLIDDPDLAPYLSPAQSSNLLRNPGWRQQRATTYANGEQTIRRLVEAGVPVLAGSDAPNPGTAHGLSMHRELELLVKAGMSATDALAAGTSLPAEGFGLEARGWLKPGYRADMLLIDGDPTQNILHTRKIETIWKNGHPVARKRFDWLAAAATESIASGLISDFELDATQVSSGMPWQETTDQMAGGQSVVQLEHIGQGADGSKGSLRISGETRAGFPFPWSGAIYFPGEQPMTPVNFGEQATLSFWIRGNVPQARIMVFSGQLGGPPPTHFVDISSEWQRIELELASIRGVTLAQLMGIAVTAPMQHGSFEIDIDQVALGRQ